jgi:hypothetical protein
MMLMYIGKYIGYQLTRSCCVVMVDHGLPPHTKLIQVSLLHRCSKGVPDGRRQLPAAFKQVLVMNFLQ